MPAPGFKPIAVYKETYERIKGLAGAMRIPMAQLVKEVFEKYEPPLPPAPIFGEKNGGEKPKNLAWPWPGPYLQVITAVPDLVKDYKSVSWIKSEEYPKQVGEEQLDHRIIERIRTEEDFKIEKVIIVSAEPPSSQAVAPWESGKVWKWISYWLLLEATYRNKITIYVVEEKKEEQGHDDLLRIEHTYGLVSLDLGIYARKGVPPEMIGFLTLGPGWEKDKSQLSYAWFFDSKKISKAEKAFEELKNKSRELGRSRILQQLDHVPRV